MKPATDYRSHDYESGGSPQATRTVREFRRTVLRLAEMSPTPSPLTDREIQCLCLCAEGKSYWESGVILGIAERTVSFHMEAVRAKLGAITNAHAVALAWAGLRRYRPRRPTSTPLPGAESLPAVSSHKG